MFNFRRQSGVQFWMAVDHSNLASQDNERLILRWVPMDGHLSPWLHSIPNPLRLPNLETISNHTRLRRKGHRPHPSTALPLARPGYKISSISSGPVGSYAPSFISRITEPLSSALTVCHCPAGIFSATTGPSGLNSTVSVQILSNSS